ncbi:protein VASP homolog [Macrobrachium nipponense]|uniref:protein VASP homolog n=1 Tax=Macrobrachium nipponense TaxID=159736 RepID=UPI0030C8CD16
MRAHYYLLAVATTLALATGEKLGDIEVITRGELGDGGLVPPNKDSFAQTNDEVIQGKNNFLSSPELKTEAKFIPPPALSYLPPVKTPLPIEPTASPYTPAPVLIKDEYLPPSRGVPAEVKPVVEPPNTLYSAPKPAAADVFLQPVATPQVPIFPASPRPAPIPPVPVPQDDSYYLEEHEVEQPGFFSNIQDSKLSVLNGIVGAKTAVISGLRNAGDSLYNGVTGALAAKAAAFSSLKNAATGGGYSSNNQAPSTYESEGGYGSNPSVGVAGTNVGNRYPAQPIPPPSSQQTPAPLYVPIPVTTYPAYPPYPPKVPEYRPPQVYAAPIPVYQYRTLPVRSRKPSLTNAISRAIRRLKAPFQPHFRYAHRHW